MKIPRWLKNHPDTHAQRHMPSSQMGTHLHPPFLQNTDQRIYNLGIAFQNLELWRRFAITNCGSEPVKAFCCLKGIQVQKREDIQEETHTQSTTHHVRNDSPGNNVEDRCYLPFGFSREDQTTWLPCWTQAPKSSRSSRSLSLLTRVGSLSNLIRWLYNMMGRNK